MVIGILLAQQIFPFKGRLRKAPRDLNAQFLPCFYQTRIVPLTVIQAAVVVDAEGDQTITAPK